MALDVLVEDFDQLQLHYHQKWGALVCLLIVPLVCFVAMRSLSDATLHLEREHPMITARVGWDFYGFSLGEKRLKNVTSVQLAMGSRFGKKTILSGNGELIIDRFGLREGSEHMRHLEAIEAFIDDSDSEPISLVYTSTGTLIMMPALFAIIFFFTSAALYRGHRCFLSRSENSFLIKHQLGETYDLPLNTVQKLELGGVKGRQGTWLLIHTGKETIEARHIPEEMVTYINHYLAQKS